VTSVSQILGMLSVCVKSR